MDLKKGGRKMKRTYIIFMYVFVVMGLVFGQSIASASDVVYKTSLVTSSAAARTHVELSADGTLAETLVDGTATINSGELEIEGNGKIKLQLEPGEEITGDGFLLLNTADADVDGDRDFLFAGLFSIDDTGEVDTEFDAEFPENLEIEDLLVTVLLDDGDTAGELDINDTMLAVPGFITGEEDGDDENEFEVSGEEIYCTPGEPCVGTNGNDIIYGTSEADEIYGGNGNDIIFGYEGDDQIAGGNGFDELYGGEGDDQLLGENGKDTLDGGEGADELNGGNGRDTIICDENDELIDSRGRDILTGCNEDSNF
jgi:Ca2+-binding RTX toxin-like protein